MNYGLPKSVEVGGKELEIRYDYRVILEIMEVLNDVELNDEERVCAMLQMFYMTPDEIINVQQAIERCFWFINGGKTEEKQKKGAKLVYWDTDFPYIAAPVNRVLGCEIRAIDYDIATNTGGLHWFTFLSAYLEIGDCYFAQIVRMRDKLAKGKKLDKADQEFCRQNADVIYIKTKYTEAENDLIKQWTAG